MVICLVSLGANLGEREQTLDEAVAQLSTNRAVHDLAESPRLQTIAIGGPSGQPAFLNSVVRFSTDAVPLDLLAILQAIEHSSQRDRTQRWAARTLDLDLLVYGDQVIREPMLRVPHPRMSFRSFVLEPAAALAPDWQHPELGATLDQLWQTLRRGHDVVRLVGGNQAERTALGHLLSADFPGTVIETRGNGREPFPRLTIDLSPVAAIFLEPSGPCLRLADCPSEHWRGRSPRSGGLCLARAYGVE